VTAVPGPPFTAAYDELRETGDGVHRRHLPDGSPVWLVTRYHDVSAALADPRLSLDKRHSTGWAGFSLPAELDANLLNLDPPDHTRIRRRVAAAFTAARVQSHRPAVRAIAAELADALPGGGPVDLIEAYAAPLPVRVISDLLGVAPGQRADVRAWTTTMLASTDRAQVGAAIMALRAYIVELVAHKRREPGDDLLGQLTTVDDDGSRLSADELTSLAFLL
jgi:cytochrome P450